MQSMRIIHQHLLHKDYSVFDLARHMPYRSRARFWNAGVDSLDVNAMGAQKCRMMNVGIVKSINPHEMVGFGCFVRLQLCK